MCHQLVGLLGRRIKADRRIRAVGLRIRHLRVHAVHAAGTGVKQVFHRTTAAILQHVQKAQHVRLHIRIRVLDGITHSGLPGQVYHQVEMLLVEQPAHAFAVGQVELDEAVVRAQAACRHPAFAYVALSDACIGQPCIFQAGVVVGVDIVQSHDAVSAGEQCFHEVRADEACGSCH